MTGQRQFRIKTILVGLRTGSLERVRRQNMLIWGIKLRTWREYVQAANALLKDTATQTAELVKNVMLERLESLFDQATSTGDKLRILKQESRLLGLDTQPVLTADVDVIWDASDSGKKYLSEDGACQFDRLDQLRQRDKLDYLDEYRYGHSTQNRNATGALIDGGKNR